MRKNQKYDKSNMFPVIVAWQKSKQSQAKFCKEHNYCLSTFQYWFKKYKEEYRELERSDKSKNKVKKFLPVQLSNLPDETISSKESFDIYYPNGVRLSCSGSIKVEFLQTLIKL